jgi:Na+/melibiose symporter-like transporter
MSGQAKAMWLAFGSSLAASLVMAGLFMVFSGMAGNDPGLARWGGAAWVLILGFIIILPTVAPAFKRRFRGD